MRLSVGLCALLVGALAGEVRAHGGTFGHGPVGGLPPGLEDAPSPGLECDCALPSCTQCSRRLVRGRLVRTRIDEETVERWDDVAALRVTVTFRGREDRPLEAYAMLAPAALFAATGGSIRQDGSQLAGSLRETQDGRRRYLWSWRRWRERDPFLLMRRGPARYHLRAYPVRKEGDTVVTVDGFALAPPQARGGPRLYRTDGRVLVVRDLVDGAAVGEGEWEDVHGRRALRFLDVAAARTLYGDRVDAAVDVPFVHALETALTGKGRTAAGDDVVLVGLPEGAELPPRVGPPDRPEPLLAGEQRTKPEPPPPARAP